MTAGGHDLTTGSISGHLLRTMSFMLVTMVFQTLYFLVDLYWVGRLGTAAVAGVGVAGNLTFVVLALSQMLGVGTTAVVSHAMGKKDTAGAVHMFNQAQVLAIVTGAAFLVVGLALRWPYVRAQSADAQTAAMAAAYLLWYIPAMALQFTIVAMGSALRAIGDFKTGMVISSATVVLNMVLAPFLIFGWVTGRPLGVAGAAVATLIAVVVACIWLGVHFRTRAAPLRFDLSSWTPRLADWKRMLGIGLPTGFEFGIMTVYLGLVYAIARPFGAVAQAGFGIGMRIVQAGFLPVVALGFAVAPVAGQNFGAGLGDRVRATFAHAARLALFFMALLAVVTAGAAEPLMRLFSSDPSVIAVGVEYLRILAVSFFASGLVFVASSMFQAMGNTMPSLVASSLRILVVAVPAVLVSRLPGFTLRWLWYLSVTSLYVQLAVALLLLRREFARRLAGPVA